MCQFPNSFFNYIFLTFGDYSIRLLKSWMKLRKAIIKNKICTRFLKHCNTFNIFPPHLYSFLNFNIHLNQHVSVIKFNNLKKKFIVNIELKMKLNDAFRNLNFSQIQIFRLERKITQHIPYYIYFFFFLTRQVSSLYYFYDIQI